MLCSLTRLNVISKERIAHIATIYITDHTAFCGVATANSNKTVYHTDKPAASGRISQIAVPAFERANHVAIPMPVLDSCSHSSDRTADHPIVPFTLLEKFLEWVMDQIGPNGDLGAIAIGCFGRFVSLDFGVRHQYGKLADFTTHDDWKDANLFMITKRLLDNWGTRFKQTRVCVNTEVGHAALGEAWRYLGRDAEIADIRRSVFVFLKVSQSINGAIADAGEIWHGRHHTLMSTIKPRRPTINGEIIDIYKGCCEAHTDCVEGLICQQALVERTGIKHLKDIPDDHTVWKLVAFYIAQLCMIITSTVSPSRIVLGGRIIVDAPPQLIPMIQAYFRKEVGTAIRSSPDYPEMRDTTRYIIPQSTNTSMHPGVEGGLIVAERLFMRSE